MTRTIVTIVAAVLCLAGCGAGDDTPKRETTSSSPTPTPSAIERWDDAVAFLGEQTKPVEVVCRPADLATNEPRMFYSFDEGQSSWRPQLLFRDDPKHESAKTLCAINVPTSHPYTTSGIESFLKPLGFYFTKGSGGPGLKRVEIAYAGATPDDPDSVFRDAPGLFGAKLAIYSEDLSFDDGIPEPTDDAQAEELLERAGPLLQWYGYQPPPG